MILKSNFAEFKFTTSVKTIRIFGRYSGLFPYQAFVLLSNLNIIKAFVLLSNLNIIKKLIIVKMGRKYKLFAFLVTHDITSHTFNK